MSIRTDEFPQAGSVADTDEAIALVSGSEARVPISLLRPNASQVAATAGTVMTNPTVQGQLDQADAALVDAIYSTLSSVAGWGWIIDEDSMVSDLDTKVPTQQSVKAYVDGQVATAAVISVNGESGAVIIDADDIGDGSTANKFTTAADIAKLATIEAGADVTEVPWSVACSDESTPIGTTGTVVTARAPSGMVVQAVRASLTSACTTGTFTVDINEGGVSILSTKITIDATETTSTTAVTAPVVSDSNIADDAEITVDVDNVGDGTATGLKVTILYRPA
jgi:hypothetical protein